MRLDGLPAKKDKELNWAQTKLNHEAFRDQWVRVYFLLPTGSVDGSLGREASSKTLASGGQRHRNGCVPETPLLTCMTVGYS